MSKAKVNNLEKRVAASVAQQYVLEAKTLHMSLSTYIAWLKAKAGYSTPYDQILANHKAQQQGQSPAKAQPELKAQGSGQGEGEGEGAAGK